MYSSAVKPVRNYVGRFSAIKDTWVTAPCRERTQGDEEGGGLLSVARLRGSYQRRRLNKLNTINQRVVERPEVRVLWTGGR